MDRAIERALRAANNAWGSDWNPDVVVRAPGRLELLGNHVDYNGGKVLAAAIDRDVVCLVSPGNVDGIEVLLADLEPVSIPLDPTTLRDWQNTHDTISPIDYVRGVIA